MNGLLSWLAPKPRGLLAQDDPNAVDLSALPNSNGGSFMTGLLGAAQSGFTLPGDVATGKVNPLSDEGIARAQDMAGLAMTGGFAGAPKQAGEAVMGSGPIRAYHGSPHNFDRFDLSKIGTGEGAQAYGHGLYFAENEATAKAYRDALRWQGSDWNNPEYVAGYWLKNLGGNPDAAVKHLEGSLKHQSTPEAKSAVEDAIGIIRGGGAGKDSANPGHMYEVAIHADPKQFLDWDLPLAQQHPLVREGVQDLGVPLERNGRPLTGRDAYLGREMDWNADRGAWRSPTEAASRELAELAGIPGIKYLDQGSRTAGDGSRNYVTFSDKIVEIMRKYGVASFAALPPAVQMMLQNGQQPDPQS